MTMQNAREVPWILIGGGLANCLLALRLESLGIDFKLIESGSVLGGDHTWSCHESDLTADDWTWLKSFTSYSWNSHKVIFPKFERRFFSGYSTLRSESLRTEIERRISSSKVLLNVNAEILENKIVRCQTSESEFFLSSHNIVLGSGFVPTQGNSGFQKFVGWDIEFADGHEITDPILMDASVEQKDGFRFIYLLPFSKNLMLVEDTRYSNSSLIDLGEFEKSLEKYMTEKFQGRKWRVVRTEQAALPIPLSENSIPGAFGVAGGFFNPTTGYSLPYAMRSSRELLMRVGQGESAVNALKIMQKQMRPQQAYYFLLNRMMFLAASPLQRRKIFSRFYGLSENLIARFYSGRMTSWDRLRMLMGKPPVGVWSALRVVSEKSQEVVWS